MNRITILNSLIAKHGYKTYLELGIRDGSCFNAINCETKIGVDPDLSSAATIFQTSDDFFADLKESVLLGILHPNKTTTKVPKTYDIVFIDAMHMEEFVYRDIINSLAVLNEGGTILMHDCLPTSEFMQLVPMSPDHNEWTGDTWRAYFKLRTEREDLEMAVCDVDWGCGLIRPGKQTPIFLDKPFSEVTYQDFVQAKNHWMNVLSADQFKQKYLD